jgi:hypothetical protein
MGLKERGLEILKSTLLASMLERMMEFVIWANCQARVTKAVNFIAHFIVAIDLAPE